MKTLSISKVLKSGSTVPVHHAMNADGTWFRRVLDGGTWTPWMVSAPAPPDAVKTAMMVKLPAGNHSTALLALAA